MRIINGRDYYDRAQSLGQDQSHVFVRDHDRVIDPLSWKSIPRLELPGVSIAFDRGKRYYTGYLDHPQELALGVVVARGCKVWLADCSWQGIAWDNLTHNTRKYIWNWQDFEKSLHEHKLTLRKTAYVPRGNQLISPEWFQPQQSQQDFLAYMIANKIVIMTCDTEPSHQHRATFRLQANGWNLGNMGFYRALPGFEAFQRIEQWISGVLPNNQNPMAEVTDKVRAEKHGFDKWSFRKPGAHSKI